MIIMGENIQKKIEDLEISLLQSNIRLSSKKLDKLIADDFKEIGASGKIYKKKDILRNLPKESQVEYKPTEFNIKTLAENIILVTYKLTAQESDRTVSSSLRSSIWRYKRNSWELVFHQGTTCK